MHRLLFLTVALAACTDAGTTDTILEQDGEVELQGTLVHLVDQAHTGAGPFVPSATAIARVTVYSIPGLDAASFTLAEKTFPVSAIPATFALTVSADKIAEARALEHTESFITATVQQANTESAVVGDLILETSTGPMPNDDIRLELTKLEGCGEQDAGGFCGAN